MPFDDVARSKALERKREKAERHYNDSILSLVTIMHSQGNSLNEIAKYLNRQGFLTVRDKPFTHSQVSRLLQSIAQTNVQTIVQDTNAQTNVQSKEPTNAQTNVQEPSRDELLGMLAELRYLWLDALSNAQTKVQTVVQSNAQINVQANAQALDNRIIELLSADVAQNEIVRVLEREGYRNKEGKPYSRGAVLRRIQKLKGGCNREKIRVY